MARRSKQNHNEPRHAAPQRALFDVLGLLKKNIAKQGILAVLTIVLTVVLLISITAAWYSNVIQTGGLVFEAAEWGFDGTVGTLDAAIKAAPGDEGIISMEMKNDSDNVIAVSVNVSKELMDTLMQQRLFFYVDTAMYRNGEAMERVYISSQEAYTYTVFGQGALTLNESMHNDAQLKWEWVYDVLGYYVTGTLDSASGAVAISEYLRPIVYDYDAATLTTETVTNADGSTVTVPKLATVDGTTTLPEFITQVSQTDGYAGVIDTESVTAAGYYPVQVDESGYGVWAYLCTYSEIEKSMLDDVSLSQPDENGAVRQHTARLIVSGQKSKVETTVVGSAAALAEALADGTSQVIQLSDNVTVASTLLVANGQRVTLDLNGHTLTTTVADDAAVQVEKGGVLTLMNGTLDGGENTVDGAHCVGGELTMSKVTLQNVTYGVYVQDNNADGADSKIRLVNATINASDSGVLLYGNGEASERATQLVVENSTINGNSYAGIICNGANWGSDIQVLSGSSVSGYWTGIYQPQPNSSLLVSNATVSGYTGIAIKGGTARILDSTVSGTGDAAEPAFANSGWTDTGDGVYLESNYPWETSIEIRGGIITSAHNQAVRLYVQDPELASITVYSGTFSTDVSAYLATGSTVSRDGNNYIVTETTQ